MLLFCLRWPLFVCLSVSVMIIHGTSCMPHCYNAGQKGSGPLGFISAHMITICWKQQETAGRSKMRSRVVIHSWPRRAPHLTGCSRDSHGLSTLNNPYQHEQAFSHSYPGDSAPSPSPYAEHMTGPCPAPHPAQTQTVSGLWMLCLFALGSPRPTEAPFHPRIITAVTQCCLGRLSW